MNTKLIPESGFEFFRGRLERAERVGECLVWPGRKTIQGYGSVSYEGVVYYVHRIAWTLEHGQIPSGEVIDHLCENPSCVEVSHLRPTDIKTNVLRGVNPVAVNSRKTSCIHGHAFDEKNTRINKRGDRVCRECDKLWQRKHRSLVKA